MKYLSVLTILGCMLFFNSTAISSSEKNTPFTTNSIDKPDPRLPKQGVKKYNRLQRLFGFGRKARKQERLAQQRQNQTPVKSAKDQRNAIAKNLPVGAARNNFFAAERQQKYVAKNSPMVRPAGGANLQIARGGNFQLANPLMANQVKQAQGQRAAAGMGNRAPIIPQRQAAPYTPGKNPYAPTVIPNNNNIPGSKARNVQRLPPAPGNIAPKSNAAPIGSKARNVQKLPPTPGNAAPKPNAAPVGSKARNVQGLPPAPGNVAPKTNARPIYDRVPPISNSNKAPAPKPGLAPAKAPIIYSKLPGPAPKPKAPDNRSVAQKREDGKSKVMTDLRKTMNQSGAPVKSPQIQKLPAKPKKGRGKGRGGR